MPYLQAVNFLLVSACLKCSVFHMTEQLLRDRVFVTVTYRRAAVLVRFGYTCKILF